MEEHLKQIITELKEIRSEINELKQGQMRLEDSQERLQTLFADHLEANKRYIIDYLEDRTEALNKRIFIVETDIQRLNRR
jgi:prefoldin subunit 5